MLNFKKVFNAVIFRIWQQLFRTNASRSDVQPTRKVKKWIRQHKDCTIETDLRIQGATDALEKISLDKGCAIDRGCIVWIAAEEHSHPELKLGENTYIGPYCFLGSFQKLHIGKNTLVGGYSYLITANHKSLPEITIRDQGYEAAPISIGEDVWIGAHVVILPGVTIEDKAIIGAGAVVTKDIPAGEKWAGVPARKIGIR